ncbi:MAG: twin-arginine translocase subunit TatC [Candidatus Nanohalobium sp.]
MSEASFGEHVEELVSRLKRVGVVFLLLSGLGLYFSPRVLSFLQSDLGVRLHALASYEVLYTEIMIALVFGLVMSLPVIYFEGLRFLRPGLRSEEYRVLRNYLPVSAVLFGVGAVFAYRFIVKASLAFFQSSTSASEVAAVWGLRNTLGFALKLSAFSGVMFQLPIASLVLSRAGLLDREMMVRYRSYFVVLVLFLAAVATPPDILSQVLLVLPVLGLYQISIYLV